MQAEVHDELSPELAREWEALFERDSEATPFSSAGWARAWLGSWQDDPVEPVIVAIRDGGELAGLAPLVIRRRGPLRVMNALGQLPADYWDVVARDDLRREVLDAVAGWLKASGSKWDVLSLTCLREGSLSERVLDESGLRVAHRKPVQCPGIELPSSFDDYLKLLPTKRRTDIRKHVRKLDEERAVELREVSDPAEFPGLLRRWQEIRVSQWSERGSEELFELHGRESFREFMLAVVQELVPAGLCMLWEFSRDGEVVGVWINFVDQRAVYWYLGGFDPALHSIGLGKIAIVQGIRSSIERGRSYFDFSVGNEGYKYWYGAADRLMPSLAIGHGGVRSRVGRRLAMRVRGGRI